MRKFSILIVVLAMSVQACSFLETATVHKTRDISFDMPEASGITYASDSNTFYVVSDKGDIAQMDTEGAIIQKNNLENANFEGITRDVNTGMLYIVIEGKDRILQVDPNTLQSLGEFTVSRKLDGDKVVSGGKQGFEGITFVPDAQHPEGGTFFVVNQATPDQKKPEPSVLLHIELPLRTASRNNTKEMKGKILGVLPMPFSDLSGVHYDEHSQKLYVLSDMDQHIIILSKNGREEKRMRVEGDNIEGITHDGERNIVIVEDHPDSGHMLILKEP